MIHKLTSYLFLAAMFWHAQLAGAQQCVADNVYFDLQSSSAAASIRLTGHSLVPVPANGLNYALLDDTDLHMIEGGVFGAGDAAFNGVLSNLAEGKWLFMAVFADGSNMNTDTVETLTTQFGASANIANLQPGQGYILVAQKGADSVKLEQFAPFNDSSKKYDDLVTRVCAAELIDCPVGGDFSYRVLMARSGGTLENGYDADVVIGGHYDWSKCEDDGLCVFVMKSNLDARFPQNGSISFDNVDKFLQFIEQESILDSDYLVLAADADASAILKNANAQAALSRWPASVSAYPTGASYLFIGRASDPSPIAEYTSTDYSVISLQCLNTQSGPVNPPGPTPAPTPEPSSAPTGVSPTPEPTPEPTVVVLVDIDVHLHIEGENLTLDITEEFTFKKAVVETVVVAVEAVTGIDLNVSDFQIINLTFHYPEDHTHSYSLRAEKRALEINGLDGILNMITSAEIYQQIADAIEQIFEQDLATIFNTIANGDFTLDSFKVLEVQSEPVPQPPTDDDEGGDGSGGDKKKKSSSSSSDDAADWVSSTTGIVVIAVCGAVVVGAVLGGIFYSNRQRQDGPSSQAPRQRAGASSTNQQASAAAVAAEQGKTPE